MVSYKVVTNSELDQVITQKNMKEYSLLLLTSTMLIISK